MYDYHHVHCLSDSSLLNVKVKYRQENEIILEFGLLLQRHLSYDKYDMHFFPRAILNLSREK